MGPIRKSYSTLRSDALPYPLLKYGGAYRLRMRTVRLNTRLHAGCFGSAVGPPLFRAAGERQFSGGGVSCSMPSLTDGYPNLLADMAI
jgi:hypothetical protein